MVRMPLAVRCTDCSATHGTSVFRLKSDPRFYMPGPQRPWAPALYETKSEKIDLMASRFCARCAPRHENQLPAASGQKRLFG